MRLILLSLVGCLMFSQVRIPGPGGATPPGGGGPTFINAGSNASTLSTTVISASSSSHSAGTNLWVIVTGNNSCATMGTAVISNTAADTWSTADTTFSQTFECVQSFHICSTIGNAGDIVTVTWTTGATALGIAVANWSGGGCTADASATGHATGATLSSGSFTTNAAHPNEIVFFGGGSFYGETFAASTIGSGTATIPTGGQTVTNANPSATGALEYIIISSQLSSATANMGASLGFGGNHYSGGIVASFY